MVTCFSLLFVGINCSFILRETLKNGIQLLVYPYPFVKGLLARMHYLLNLLETFSLKCKWRKSVAIIAPHNPWPIIPLIHFHVKRIGCPLL